MSMRAALFPLACSVSLPPAACDSGFPCDRRTRAYGGALRAYDKNRRHPIPAIFALGQYCAVNLAEVGDVRK